jgi:hypothetical protein
MKVMCYTRGHVDHRTGPDWPDFVTDSQQSGTSSVACQRDGTTSLPRAWDHLEVLVSITGPWFRCQRRRAG